MRERERYNIKESNGWFLNFKGWDALYNAGRKMIMFDLMR